MPDRHADYTEKLRKSAFMRAILVESVQFSGSGPLKTLFLYVGMASLIKPYRRKYSIFIWNTLFIFLFLDFLIGHRVSDRLAERIARRRGLAHRFLSNLFSSFSLWFHNRRIMSTT